MTLPENSKIVKVELILKRFDTSGRAGAACHRISELWDPEKVTWVSPIAYNDNPIEVIEEDSEWLQFDVTNTVKDHIQNPDQNFGFMITRPPNLDTKISCRSSEYTDVSQRPKLVFSLENTSIITDDIPVIPIVNTVSNKFSIRRHGSAISLFLPWQGLSIVQVFNAQGKMVGNIQTEAQQNWFDLPAFLSSGNYLLIVNSPQRKVMQKFSVVR